MTANCWLIDDQKRPPAVALEIARLRGMKVDRLAFSSEASMAELKAAASLLTISFDRLRELSAAARSRFKRSVEQGITLHVKGGMTAGQPVSFAPFADGQLTAIRTAATGYHLTDHPMLTAMLKNEERPVELAMLAVSGLPVAAEPLLMTHCADGIERPSIFIIRAGNGVVIYDLTPEAPAQPMPLLTMLEDPMILPAGVGALTAASIAWKAQPPASQLNLVIDDRPADFDYFNCARVLAFLRHLEHNFAGVHVDFAWTPDQSHPGRQYVAALKSFRAGFVWHGLRRHVDHRAITDLDAEYAAGRRLVEDVGAAYGVRFQPVMVFPFERETPQCVEFLERRGFIGKAHTPAEPRTGVDNGDSVALGVARPKPRTGRKRFAILERFPAERLTRDRMLARALLGLPIIAAAHPRDVGLVRLAGLRRARGSFAHFDPVVRFAAEKHLRSASLEEIAQRAIEQ